MVADYEKKLINQLDDALAAIELLKEGQRSLKEEIRSLKKENESALVARDAQHRKEIKLINSLHEKKLAAGNARIAILEAENAKLKVQINKDSSNSGKPPSSNGFKNIPNSREKTGKKPGGQKGHKGHIPLLFEHPDEVTDLNRTTCDCGGPIKYGSSPAIKQLVDIEVVLHVKEFRAGVGYCADCGKKIKNSFPDGVTSTVNIGNGIKAMSAMLLHEGAVSVSRTKQFLSGITGGALNISEGSIVNFTKELSGNLDSRIGQIKDKLASSTVNHKDETGLKMNGKRWWLHVLCNDKATYYMAHMKRGTDADGDMGVLGSYGGTLVHDHLKALYGFACTHAECNVHVIRYLKSVIENDKPYAALAKQLISLLVDANNERKKLKLAGEVKFPDDVIERYENSYKTILQEWNDMTNDARTQRKKKKQSDKYKPDAEALGKRLWEYRAQHLLFLKDFEVPFENNLAERDLRMAKTKMKVSGSFRSEGGCMDYARIRSFLSTTKKQKKDLFAELIAAFAGTPATI